MPIHHKEERTLVVIKPDGVQRALVGEIIARYERTGLNLIGMKMLDVDKAFIEKHYTLDPHWKQSVGEKSIKGYKDKGLVPPYTDPQAAANIILNRLQEYFIGGPVIALVWQGGHAVAVARKVTGGTEPLTSPIGSIRGDYVLDSYAMSEVDDRAVRNLVHASGSPEEAEQEIAHWFSKDELMSYTHARETVIYNKIMGF